MVATIKKHDSFPIIFIAFLSVKSCERLFYCKISNALTGKRHCTCISKVKVHKYLWEINSYFIKLLDGNASLWKQPFLSNCKGSSFILCSEADFLFGATILGTAAIFLFPKIISQVWNFRSQNHLKNIDYIFRRNWKIRNLSETHYSVNLQYLKMWWKERHSFGFWVWSNFWIDFWAVWFSFFRGLFNAKAILLEEQQWYYENHSSGGGVKMVHIFPKWMWQCVWCLISLSTRLQSSTLTITSLELLSLNKNHRKNDFSSKTKHLFSCKINNV